MFQGLKDYTVVRKKRKIRSYDHAARNCGRDRSRLQEELLNRGRKRREALHERLKQNRMQRHNQHTNPTKEVEKMADVFDSFKTSIVEDMEIQNLTKDEYEDMMVFLEEAFVKDMRREEFRLLQEFVDREEEQQNQADCAAWELECNLQQHQDSITCPLCMSGAWFLSSQNVISCTNCSAKLNLGNDPISMSNIQDHIASLYDRHQCTGKLEFEIRCDFGVQNLIGFCRTCGNMEVVV